MPRKNYSPHDFSTRPLQVTTAEAAFVLGVSVDTLEKIPDEMLPRVRIGASQAGIRFRLDDLDRYSKASRTAPPPKLPRLAAEFKRKAARTPLTLETDEEVEDRVQEVIDQRRLAARMPLADAG